MPFALYTAYSIQTDTSFVSGVTHSLTSANPRKQPYVLRRPVEIAGLSGRNATAGSVDIIAWEPGLGQTDA